MLDRTHNPPDLTGNELRAIRQAFGLSIDQFARSIGIHPVTLNRWELAGPTCPHIEGTPRHILLGLRNQLVQAGHVPPHVQAQIKPQGVQIEELLAAGAVLAALAIIVAIAAKSK